MDTASKDFVTVSEASNIMGKGMNYIGKLCRAGRFPDAEKMGNSWIIPRESVLSYKKLPPGPKPRKARLMAERASILEKAKGTPKEGSNQ